MAAPSPAYIVEDPDPLNITFAHPLPVLPFPAQFQITYGDMFGLAGDTGAAGLPVALSYEPSQH
jgi:hypothetical protein